MPKTLSHGGVLQGKGEGKPYWLLTDHFTFKVTAEDTGGTLAIAELAAPAGFGPPPHVHLNCHECFYVLEGTMDFSLADQKFSASAGGFVFLPKGVVHTHQAGGNAPARALAIQTPAGVEKFIAEAGEPAPDPSARPAAPEIAKLMQVVAIAKKHGIEVPPM